MDLDLQQVTTCGEVQLAFHSVQDRTILSDCYASSPLRVLFPQVSPDTYPNAVIATTSGGLVGGDQLTIAVTASIGAKALVTWQAAEKVYRSNGKTACVNMQLTAARGTWLECLPQETIIFNGARLRRTTVINADAGSCILAGEMLVLGRIARGECFNSGLLHDVWQVRRNGCLMWMDALRLATDIGTVRNHPAGLGGAIATATVLYVADDVATQLTRVRRLLTSVAFVGRVAATVVRDVLVVRWLADDVQVLRTSYGEFWGGVASSSDGIAAGAAAHLVCLSVFVPTDKFNLTNSFALE